MTSALDLSLELYGLTGWGKELEGVNTNRFFWVQDGGDKSIAHRYDEWVRNGKYPIVCPAYETEYLINKLLADGTIRLRLRREDDKFVATAPQCYRFEGETVADAVCRFTIDLVKKGVL